MGLLTTMPTVLISGGRRGVLVSKELFKILIRSPKSFQVAVVCGKNIELKTDLEKISSPPRHPVKIFSFIENQDVLMSAVNVLVSKPGGPTIAEAVAKKLPVVLIDAHPGHEQANIEYLVRHNIVAYGRIAREAAFLVEKALTANTTKQATINFEKLIHPPGAHNIVEAIDLIAPPPKNPPIKSYLEEEN